MLQEKNHEIMNDKGVDGRGWGGGAELSLEVEGSGDVGKLQFNPPPRPPNPPAWFRCGGGGLRNWR